MLPAWTKLAGMFVNGDSAFRRRLADARRRAPLPVLWLLGRTQSGKSSIVRYLTGSDEPEIGGGFRPCTRFTREYPFPSVDAPLLSFLDTRGLDEPGYDPQEDISACNDRAHLIMVTVKVTDHGQERVLDAIRAARAARPGRPIILALTCLHELYPQQQHVVPYPFGETLYPEVVPTDLLKAIAVQHERFKPLVDDIVPIDLTPPVDGFSEPDYGGPELRRSVMDHLPAAMRQTLVALDTATHEFRDEALRRAMPIILSYSTLAAGAGAIPLPFVDLLMLPAIQAKMVADLAQLYGQPMTGERFWEIASSLGMGVLARQAAREASKFIPVLGAAAAATLAAGTTFALGRAFCHYYQAIREGHVPDPAQLKQLFESELSRAGRFWQQK